MYRGIIMILTLTQCLAVHVTISSKPSRISCCSLFRISHVMFLKLLFFHPCLFVHVDIQILMGSLVYLRHGIENSPYRSLLETNQWAEICNIFTRDACALLGLSVESPLSVRSENTAQHARSITTLVFLSSNQDEE